MNVTTWTLCRHCGHRLTDPELADGECELCTTQTCRQCGDYLATWTEAARGICVACG
jgi:hypothetical protein